MDIYLHFYGTSKIPLAALEDIAHELRKSLIRIEKRELRRIRKSLPGIPSSAITSVIGQIDDFQSDQRVFQIRAVKEGSVGIWIAGTALAYWLLDKTLGQTLTEAWQESDLHRNLKKFFLKGKTDKLRLMERDINRTIQTVKSRQARSSFDMEVPMKATLNEEEGNLSIRIQYSEYEKTHTQIPTYSEIE